MEIKNEWKVTIMIFWGVVIKSQHLTLHLSLTLQICPEMQVNKMHTLYDKHHKVSWFRKAMEQDWQGTK